MIELIATSFLTLFVIVDPIAVAPMFAALTQGMSEKARRAAAIKGISVAAGVLLIFALFGDLTLRSLGISLPAFRIAGGVMLFILAVEMLFAHESGLRSTTTGEAAETTTRKDISVFPLGIPLLAGPGSMASIILLIGAQSGDLVKQGAVIATLMAVLLLSLVMLLAASRIVGLLGVTGVNVVTRIFGIILGALATQYIIDGIRQAFPGIA